MADRTPFGAYWTIHAPWAHPIWSDYLLVLVDLTTPVPTGEPVTFWAEGVTHEVTVHAMDPKAPRPSEGRWVNGPPPFPVKLLTPMNHGYQFAAEGDRAALTRIDKIVGMIRDQRLSPDTDFVRRWDQLFADGVSARHRFSPRRAFDA